jgi:hypothetical protein
MCCKVFAIEELNKPANVWCQHCPTGRGGCNIYSTRPDLCRAFYCIWRTDPSLGDEWKPSHSKIVVWRNLPSADCMFTVDPAVPNRWRETPYHDAIKTTAYRGLNGRIGSFRYRTYVTDGTRMLLILPRGEVEVGSGVHIILDGGDPQARTAKVFETPEQARQYLRDRPLAPADFKPMFTVTAADMAMTAGR